MERPEIWFPSVVNNLKSGITTVGSAGLSNVPTVGLYTHRDGRSGAILLAHSAKRNAIESCSTVSCLDLAPRIGRPRSWFSFMNGRRKRIGISLTPREPVVLLRLHPRWPYRFIWIRPPAGLGFLQCEKNPLKPSKAQSRAARQRLGVRGLTARCINCLIWQVKSASVPHLKY